MRPIRLEVGDVNDVVQAATGGQAVTQVYEGERWFDLVVRFMPEFRRDMDSIGNIAVQHAGRAHAFL
jgi:cobalt-zinc-cadmium resistance protein CzcA